MKDIEMCFYKACMVVACALAIVGCSMDTIQLAEHVMKEMQAELVKTDGLKSLQMKEVLLVKEDGINYTGVGKGEIDGQTIKFDVKCKYDGKTVLWNAKLSDDNLLSLSAKEKVKEISEKIKSLWPDVKDGFRQQCEAAAKNAGEFCGSAAQKAVEGLDSVKEKINREVKKLD